jgi:hypothetical protein
MAAPTALDLAPGDPPLTIAEVAEHYRMPERQMRKVIRDRNVEVLRYGRTVRFDRHALLSLEEALRVRSPIMPSPSPSPTTSRRSAYENALRATTTASQLRAAAREARRTKQEPANGEDKR